MRPSKGAVNLSVQYFLKKAYSEAEAVEKTAKGIVTAYKSPSLRQRKSFI